MTIFLGASQILLGDLSTVPPERAEWPQQMQHALDRESVGDFAGAERILIAAIHQAEQPGSDPQWLPTALDRLGVLNWDLGRTRQAEHFYLRAVDLWETRFGPSTLGLASALSDLAWAYVELGDASRGESLWGRSIEIQTAILGPFHPRVAQVYGYMAVGAFRARRLSEAESFCQQALSIYERSGTVPGETDQVLSSLASVRLQQGRASEAIQLLNEAIQLAQTAKHPAIRLLAGYFYSLALAETAGARPAEAEANFQQALSLLAGPPYDRQTLRCNILSSYARFLSRAGHKKQARKAQQEAASIAHAIRRDALAEYVADVSSFR